MDGFSHFSCGFPTRTLYTRVLSHICRSSAVWYVVSNRKREIWNGSSFGGAVQILAHRDIQNKWLQIIMEFILCEKIGWKMNGFQFCFSTVGPNSRVLMLFYFTRKKKCNSFCCDKSGSRTQMMVMRWFYYSFSLVSSGPHGDNQHDWLFIWEFFSTFVAHKFWMVVVVRVAR